MEKLGKYNNINCYRCTDREYKEAMKLYNNKNVIYIIDGTMVRDGIIVGYYDGHHVRDVYDGVPYVVVKQPGPQMPVEKELEVPVTTGETEIKEIVYSDYTKIVDNFFAHLNDPVV